MNKTYETMLLLDNREVKKSWDTLKRDVLGLFAKHTAEVVSARRWDERRLAYPIKGQQRGTYLLVYYNVQPTKVAAITRELRFAEPVLRSMTTTCEVIPEEAFQPEAAFDPTTLMVEEVARPAVVEEVVIDDEPVVAEDEAVVADDEPIAPATEEEEQR